MERITDDIFIGGKTTKEAVAHNKIKYVVNIAAVEVDFKTDKVLRIADSGEGNKPERFVEIIKEIDKAVKEKKTPVLVMCRGGLSRSPTVAALYLYYRNDFKTFNEALEYVYRKSSLLRPNPELIDFIKLKVIPLLGKAES